MHLRALSSSLAVAILLTGCSSTELSRNQVRRVIDSDFKNATRSVIVNFGTATRTPKGTFCDDQVLLPFAVKYSREAHYDSAGLVTLTEQAPCGDWEVELTSLAKRDIRHHDTPSIENTEFVTIATLQNYKVTGIVQDRAHAAANVELNFNLTPSGEALAKAGGAATSDKNCSFKPNNREMVCTESLFFTRFDDSWRVGTQTTSE